MITTEQVLLAFKNILMDGLLRIRAGSSLSFCQNEANHLHNIPSLMLNPDRGVIHYYYTIERVEYLSELDAKDRVSIEDWYKGDWRIIAEYLSETQ